MTPFRTLCSVAWFLKCHFLFCCLLLCSFPLCSCGLLAKNTEISAEQADQNQMAGWQTEPVPYKVVIKVKNGPASLESKMKDLSQLEQLHKELPDSQLALERRGMMDQETAVKLLHSQCYYDGKAEFHIDDQTKPVTAVLTLEPGPIFTVGYANVTYEPQPVIPEAFQNRIRETGFFGLETEKLPPPAFPSTIPNVEIGQPIVADDMLKAVESIPEKLRSTGYPLAKIVKSEYTLNQEERHLNASIVIDPGPPTLMGNIVIKGDHEVNPAYLRKLMTWKVGKEPWDDGLMQDYANILRSLGIFRSVEVKPEEEGLQKDPKKGGAAVMPILVEVEDGPTRSLSASARYDSDTGFGVEGTWEHRNLFHNGEKLYVDVPISQQESGIKTHFEKPAFLDRDTRLLANGSALWENSEAYYQQSISGDLGLEHKFDRDWWASISMLASGGYLKDNEHDQKPYLVLSPRGSVHYDGRNNRLNPSSGAEGSLELKPFSGYYEEPFNAFAGVLTLAGYYPVLGRKPDGKIDNTIVLAARGEAGAMPWSSSLRSIPANLRYYTGGAGSVRGYVYQSIGPRDSEGDPLGGRSYQVVNLEARFMVTDDIGIVPFLDGGMVYKDEWPRIFGDMDWGTGLGFRYYTPIGPVRLDIATPLHRIDDDPPIQFYISIGQSF